MAKTREQKDKIIEGLRERFSRATSVIVAQYGAMNVAQSQALRKLLEVENAEYVAVKKTLLDVCVKDQPNLGLKARELQGSVSLIFGYADEVAPAKVLAMFRKKNEVIDAVGGIFERAWITKEQVQTLSNLPSKQQLRGQLVGLLNAPVSGLVGVLNANLRNVVGVIDAIGKAKS